MADRIALAIEPDNDTANQIKRLLEPKGFQVENISNGDDAMEWGRTNKPSVIILSVEPRKVGYAISNKLRRSPSLREVPLVLISSEETLATFEQHKKLKSRADEYLLKPLEESVFVAKVAGLVGIAAAATKTFTSWTPIRTSCWRRTTRTSSSARRRRRGARRCWSATACPQRHVGASRSGHRARRRSRARSSIPRPRRRSRRWRRGRRRGSSQSNDMVDLRNLWSDDDLPPNLGWEQGPGQGQAEATRKPAKPPATIRTATARARRWARR